MLVNTCVGMSIELLRPVPVVLAILRSFIGPRLSERERQKTFLGLRPLADPLGFYHSHRLAVTVLYFMVFFVYAVIQPLSNYFLFLCFFIQKGCFVSQFIHIYPTFPDSGGQLWIEFFAFVPWGMIISQITIIGMLGLKRALGAPVAMVPLFVCTVLFWYYVRQEHFRLATVLSARECAKADIKNAEEGVDWSFLRGKYVQPELLQVRVSPENALPERYVFHGAGNSSNVVGYPRDSSEVPEEPATESTDRSD